MLTMLGEARMPRGQLRRLLWSALKGRTGAKLEYAEGIPYVRIDCERGGRGYNWRKAAAFAAGREVLLENGLEPPELSGITPFVPRVLPRRMLENLACGVLEQLREHRARLKLGLCGRGEGLERLMRRSVSLAGEIRICAAPTPELERLAHELLCEWGAAVILSDRPEVTGECQVVVSSEGMPCARSRGALVFSPRAQRDTLNVASVRLEPPEYIKSAVRGDFDPLLSVAAFCELGGDTRLLELTPSEGLVTTSHGAGELKAESLSRYAASLI